MLISPIITIAGISISGFIFAFLLFQNRNQGNRLLASLIFIFFLGYLVRYFLLQSSPIIIFLPFIFLPLVGAFGPLAFLYAKYTLFNKESTGRSLLAFFLFPTLILIGHFIMHFSFEEFSNLRAVIGQVGIIGWYTNIVLFFLSLYNSFFLLQAFRLTYRYQNLYKENFSSDDFDQVVWLRLFTFTILVGSFTIIVSSAIKLFTSKTAGFPLGPVEGVAFLAIQYLLLYYLLKKPKVVAILEDGKQNSAKYAKQSLNKSQREQYRKRIETYMVSKKPFLDKKLTLKDLADDLGITSHHCSMVINIEMKQNFFQYVNFHRTQEAIRLLNNPEYNEQNVLEIAFRAGFQSKGTFNKAFKERMGCTPSEYRTTCMQQAS